mgnify:CR=1 FL=1
MNFEENIRQIIREEVRAAIGAQLVAIRAELEEIREGTPAELRGLMTLEQLSDYLGVKSSQTARAWCNKNKIKLRKIGTATRVLGADVHQVLKK